MLLLLLPRRCLMPAINKGGQSESRGGRGEENQKKRLLFTALRPAPTKSSLPSGSLLLSWLFFSMALDSLTVPSYPSDLGSNRATRTQQRIRKDERTWTADTYAPYDDGHQWRKYGEKKLSNSSFPRFYYRCTYKNDMKCPATKQIQQKDTNDPPLYSVTYFNQHTCNSSSRSIGSASDIPARSSSRKAVSICFNSQATGEQHTFLTSSATLQPPSARSYRANQQPGSSTSYTRQFQWAETSSSTTSNAPVEMEADDFAGASTSSNATTGALSRTLLPIGQSRCIEYFHFL